MSFLAIDIGNTRLKWAVYDAMHPGARLLAHGAVFIENIDTLAEDEWKDLAAPQAMIGCCVASDAVRRRVEEQIEELWDFPPVWVVASSQEDEVINGYDHPSRLGADRWVAMIGARWHLLNGGRPRPALVVMVGTAVTVDALDASGHFLGGLILPGHGIMLRALESGTAGLRVPTGEVRDFPTNTSDALTTGGTFAIAGAIDRMYHNLTERCGEPPSCWLTGGAGWKMAPHLGQEFELVETLIFDGLLHIAQRRAQAKRAL